MLSQSEIEALLKRAATLDADTAAWILDLSDRAYRYPDVVRNALLARLAKSGEEKEMEKFFE